jgi:hypothetical protein
MFQGSGLAAFLRGEPWEQRFYETPKVALDAIGMSRPMERTMLSWLAEVLYTGAGEVVELGAFIGASSASLGSGLARNAKVADKAGRIHVFDRFVGEFEAQWIREKTKMQVGADHDFFHLYKKQTAAVSEYLTINRGNFLDSTWSKPIEIMYVDLAKNGVLTDKVVHDYFPHLMPGRSVVIMQDYLGHTLCYNSVLAEVFADYFERAGDTGRANVLFVNTKPIPADLLRSFRWDDIPLEMKAEYLMQAMGKQRTYLQREFIASQIGHLLSSK